MYKKLLIFILFFFITTLSVQGKSAVTYTLSGGRLGDNLLAYCHAKWISYCYDIPLLYVPFAYSDQLVLHEKEIHLDQSLINKFDQIFYIHKVSSYTIEPEKNILYVIPYFPESIIERSNPRYFFYFSVDWNNIGFKKVLQEMIKPHMPLKLIEKSSEYISVALHMRIGTGFDCTGLENFKETLTKEKGSQLKFPTLDYYWRSLKKLANFYPNQKLFVHIFTDHTNPAKLP